MGGSLIAYFKWRAITQFKTNLLVDSGPSARITTSGLLINNKYVVSFNNQDGNLERCQLQSFLGKQCLEFTISRAGGKGHNYEHFNLLIPRTEIDIQALLLQIQKFAVIKP
ncbi:hypothetical protein [Flavobacterium sp. ASW18X]|uniref:hypothetical protein n=1 Tax=Flavobacterium sp. ASW18X TaxID=2572595 RepID=UPI0010ADC18D|nr:hypothetical protein [Flavobacterium sp. ASW18X]TKD61436.1 hypothetical protein FBT53_11695 [Flavobacterium sp. ASW18X]